MYQIYALTEKAAVIAETLHGFSHFPEADSAFM
jgi:hypothetical protein